MKNNASYLFFSVILLTGKFDEIKKTMKMMVNMAFQNCYFIDVLILNKFTNLIQKVKFIMLIE
jgi:hypothetical protein